MNRKTRKLFFFFFKWPHQAAITCITGQGTWLLAAYVEIKKKKKNMHRQQLLAAKYTEKKNVVSKQKMKP